MLGRIRERLRALLPGDDEGAMWASIPDRQYAGGHAESGGLSRGEQEAAIRDVHEQAEEFDDAT